MTSPGDWPQTAPLPIGVAAPFVIGGDSISQICYGSIPLTAAPGVASTLANRLANRADVRAGFLTVGQQVNISSGWAHWLEALSGGRCILVKNGGITGAAVATQLAAYQNPSSPYYMGDLVPNPPAFAVQEGAGGDDNGITSVASVESTLSAIYAQFSSWWPQAKVIAWTQTPVSPNDDTFRRPIDQYLRNVALYTSISLADAERVMMRGSTGQVAGNGYVTITIASPGVFTFTSQTSGGSAATHGLSVGDLVFFNSSGALPTGLISGVPYFVSATGLTSSAFQVSATPGGASVITTGAQSGNQTVFAHRNVSADGIHPHSGGGYDLAKMMLELVGDLLPHEQGFVNDYNSDTTVQTAQGGWATDALMNGTPGTGVTATNWSTTGAAGFTTALIPREDNYGNWQRVSAPAGVTTPTETAVYRFGSTAFPAGAIIHLECEVRWPFADLVACTDIALNISTSGGGGGSGCEAYELTAFGQSPATYPYRTPPPGERWVLRTKPIIVPTGGITGQTYSMYFTAIAGTMDVGRFSLVRDA